MTDFPDETTPPRWCLVVRTVEQGRRLIALAMVAGCVAACDRADEVTRGSGDPVTSAAQHDWGPRDFTCHSAIKLLGEHCPGLAGVSMETCTLTAEPQTTNRDAATLSAIRPGDFVSFGLPGPEWFLRDRQLLLANNDLAKCGDLHTVGGFIRANEPRKWCTDTDAAKARAIDRATDEATFGVDDPTTAARAKANALKRAARDLGMSEKEARELHQRAIDLCRSQLRDETTDCTASDIRVAKALRAAHDTVPRVSDGEALLRSRNDATKRAAKELDIGPSEAERIHDKVIEYCPAEVLGPGGN